MSAIRRHEKPESMPQPNEIEEMLNRANDVPGVADVLRVYANLTPTIATFQAYSASQSVPPTSSASATIA
jgi:hypothetical protein